MTSSKIRLITASGIAILIILTQVLYDPISSAKHVLTISSVRSQLPQAQAKWEKLEITNYTFEIIGDARSICQPSARIEVKNDIVVNVELLNTNLQVLLPDQWADPDWGHEVFLCNYNHFTMPQIFKLVEQTLQNFPSSIVRVRHLCRLWIGKAADQPLLQCIQNSKLSNTYKVGNTFSFFDLRGLA
jgi:hypothetical protein